MQEFTFQVFEAFTAATVIYILDQPRSSSFGMRWLETQASRCPGLIGAGGVAAAGALTMFAGFDLDVIQRSFGYLFREGMTFTLTLTALAMAGGIFFGTLLAMMRLSSFKRAVAASPAGYVNLMRSIPLVLVIFWFYFLVPYIGAWILRQSRADPGRRVPVVGDHVHDVRGGVLLRDHARRHPVDPARAGVGRLRARPELLADDGATIVLPQAFRNMLPMLLTQTIILFQDTSLVYVLSITDFLGAATQGRAARRAAGRDVPLRRARLLHHLLLAVATS